jgi:hypothetical protein
MFLIWIFNKMTIIIVIIVPVMQMYDIMKN